VLFSFRIVDVEMDTQLFNERLGVAERRGLKRVGFATREKAVALLANGPGESRPGQPPKSHTGALKRFLRYAVEGKSMVVGPQLLARKGQNAAQALEKGGRSQNANGKFQTVAKRPFMVPSARAVATQGLPTFFEDSFKAQS